MGTSRSSRRTRKDDGVRVADSRGGKRRQQEGNLESMSAQKMDNDSEVYSEWPAQQRMKIIEAISWSVEE